MKDDNSSIVNNYVSKFGEDSAKKQVVGANKMGDNDPVSPCGNSDQEIHNQLQFSTAPWSIYLFIYHI